MHWLFFDECLHTISDFCIWMPKFSPTNSIAAAIDKPNGSPANGVDLEIIDTNIPALIPAPCLAVFYFMAKHTLHKLVIFQIFERRIAYKAFFLHSFPSLFNPVFTYHKAPAFSAVMVPSRLFPARYPANHLQIYHGNNLSQKLFVSGDAPIKAVILCGCIFGSNMSFIVISYNLEIFSKTSKSEIAVPVSHFETHKNHSPLLPL